MEKETMGAEKTALIAGMGRELDCALANLLLGEGIAVELFIHGDDASLTDIPGPAKATAVDLADEDSLEAAVRLLAGRRGRLDYLITCPDFRIERSLSDTSLVEWQDTMALNLTSVFLLCKQVVPLMMQERSGRIINVSSDAARMGAVNGAAYAAAKAGLITFSKSLAREVADSGIRVNIVSLGMMGGAVLSFGGERDLSAVPLKRAGKWDDAASMVLSLLNDNLDYMTGQTVHINGGLYMP